MHAAKFYVIPQWWEIRFPLQNILICVSGLSFWMAFLEDYALGCLSWFILEYRECS